MPYRRSLTARLETGLQGPPLPDTDPPEARSSNILSNILLESDCTGIVKTQVRRPVMSRAMIVFMISLVPP
jgi:hypothetical protein